MFKILTHVTHVNIINIIIVWFACWKTMLLPFVFESIHNKTHADSMFIKRACFGAISICCNQFASSAAIFLADHWSWDSKQVKNDCPTKKAWNRFPRDLYCWHIDGYLLYMKGNRCNIQLSASSAHLSHTDWSCKYLSSPFRLRNHPFHGIHS